MLLETSFSVCALHLLGQKLVSEYCGFEFVQYVGAYDFKRNVVLLCRETWKENHRLPHHH